jgi:hypothetical protein
LGFSVLSWNVEHFGGGETPARQTRVVKHLKDPDIRKLMETSFPDHDFVVTDGPQLREILIGCRRGVIDQKLFEQKREYQEGNDKLRPGALLSVRQGTEWTKLLLLHADSGSDAGALGNRFDHFRKVWSLWKAIARRLRTARRGCWCWETSTPWASRTRRREVGAARGRPTSRSPASRSWRRRRAWCCSRSRTGDVLDRDVRRVKPRSRPRVGRPRGDGEEGRSQRVGAGADEAAKEKWTEISDHSAACVIVL